jgi:hypothetical protein
MLKTKAIDLLGGIPAAANAIGITAQAIGQWPDVLPPRIADRVQAALARKHLPPELIGLEGPSATPVPAGHVASPPAP